MNSFFRRLPLPVKLLLIGLIPLGFLLYLSVQVYYEETQKVRFLRIYHTHIREAGNINILIDELQNERRYSFDFAMKKVSPNVLFTQRERTDSVLKKIKNSSDEILTGFTDYTFLNDLQGIRSRIDTGHLGPDVVMSYYTNVIFRINTLSTIPTVNNNYIKPVYKDLVGQKLLSEMITLLGIIRSNIYNVLATGKNAIGTIYGLRGVYDVYNTYITEFLLKGSSSSVQSYNRIRNTTALKPTIEYLDGAFQRVSIDSTYNAEEWWKISANGIEEIRKLQHSLWHNAESRMNEIYEDEKNKKNRTLIFLIISFLFVFSIVGYTIHVITKMLTELKAAAQKISRGATGLEFNIVSDDVIGNLAESISKIDENNKVLAETADAIGKGNFDVPVKPRSPEDLLGNSIIRMKNNLEKFTRENDESKEQFRQLADSMPQMVWTARPDGYFDYYNKQWYDYTGFKEGNGDQTWLPILHPDDVELCMNAWDKSIQTGAPYQVEYRFKDKRSGGYKWFLGKALPVRDASGTVIKWFGTCTEIQNQKMLEEELERKVKERTDDLKHANADLERSNNDLEQFAYIASHDLQEPIRKIRMFSEYIKDTDYDLLSDVSKIYIDKICSAAERMKRIIKDLLDLSHLNTNKDQFETIDLNKILNEVKIDLELLLLQKKAVVEADILPVIEAIPIQITQLFYNLLNNSLKFSVEEKPPEIRISYERPDKKDLLLFPNIDVDLDYIQLAFSDNGIGFDQKYAKQIFTMFHRLNDKTAFSGTGIGLALCKKIVEIHQGGIAAYSQPGEGSMFKVILPRLQVVT